MKKLLFPVLTGLLAQMTVAGAEAKPKPAGRPPMDLGPAVSFIFNNAPTNRPLGTPDERLVLKALNIRLGTNAGVAFDTERLRYAAGWTGGFIDVRKSSILASAQGSSPVFPIGQKVFSTSPSGTKPAGAKYKGHYLHGDQVVLSYSIDGTDILDLPGIETENGVTAFTRTLRINPSDKPLEIFVSENSPPSLTVVSGGAGIETRRASRCPQSRRRWRRCLCV